MIAFALSALFFGTALVTLVSLSDSTAKGFKAYKRLSAAVQIDREMLVFVSVTGMDTPSYRPTADCTQIRAIGATVRFRKSAVRKQNFMMQLPVAA